MAIIQSKVGFTLGTNVKFHIANKTASDITITDNADGTGTLSSDTMDWEGTSELAGIVNRPLVVGDVITLSHTGVAGNEGKRVTITSFSGTGPYVLNYDDTADGALTTQAAGAAINVVAFKKTWQFLEASGLSFVDGVDSLYFAGWVVDQWDTGDLDIYDPIFTSIEPRAKSMAAIYGWEPHDNATLKAHRNMALEIRADANTAASRIYHLFKSGNTHAPTDQFTFWPSSDAWDTAPTLAVTTGYINELVLTYDVAGADNRYSNGVTWTTRCMMPGKTPLMQEFQLNYAEIISVGSSNAIDPKLADATGAQLTGFTDGDVSAGGIFSLISFNSDVDGIYSGTVVESGVANPYDFKGYVEGNNQTNQAVHAKIHWLWRSSGNINSDVSGAQMRGDKQWPLTSFSGNVFTLNSYIENFDTSDRNNLRVVTDGGVTKNWDIIYTLSVIASALMLQGGTGTFSVIHADTHGTSTVVYLQNESFTDQKDVVVSSGTTNITIPYSGYSVDGHTPGDPIEVVLTWNNKGVVEPDNDTFIISGDKSFSIPAKADPSYI